MNTLNICAILVAATLNLCATSAYSCEATPRDIYESCCYMGQDLKCYSEEEYPNYKVTQPREGVLKVTATYKGRTFVKLYSDTIVGEDVSTSYSRMDSGMARVLATCAEYDGKVRVILERIYSQDSGQIWVHIPTGVASYTTLSYKSDERIQEANYYTSKEWWVTDRLTSIASMDIYNSEDGLRILTAATLANLSYRWVRDEVRRSQDISRSERNRLYQMASGRIQAV